MFNTNTSTLYFKVAIVSILVGLQHGEEQQVGNFWLKLTGLFYDYYYCIIYFISEAWISLDADKCSCKMQLSPRGSPAACFNRPRGGRRGIIIIIIIMQGPLSRSNVFLFFIFYFLFLQNALGFRPSTHPIT